MRAIIGTFCISIVFIAGGLDRDAPLAAVVLASIGAIGLGVLFAVVSRYRDEQYATVTRPADGEVTLGRLHETVMEDDLILFHEVPFAPVTGFYVARIGGRRVLVMEKGEAENG